MTRQIAICEHSPSLRRLFQTILTQQGYTVSTFEEDENGFEQVKALCPDIIILGNIRIQAEQEFWFLHLLRKQPELKDTPIIIATTGTPQLLQSERLEEQAQLCLLYKPFERQQLLECVALALKDGKETRATFIG